MQYLVIGGTGTLGTEIISRLSTIVRAHDSIICYSRDELKQQRMQKAFPHVDFAIGDIRDEKRLRYIMEGIDVVFIVAALKHIDVCERNPDECYKTNVSGVINTVEAATRAGVQTVVFSSTDKAVKPINAYGASKMLAEKYIYSLKNCTTKCQVYRWGNVIGSRGSAIPYFAECLKNGTTINITHPDMTRFWIKIEKAVDFMFSRLNAPWQDSAFIPEMKAAKLLAVLDALADVMEVESFTTRVVGIRDGEKIHEDLISGHDYCLRSDNAPQFTHSELMELLCGYGKNPATR